MSQEPWSDLLDFSSKKKMRIKTVLNHILKHTSFVYKEVRFDDKKTLTVRIEARSNSKAICSGCERKRPGYDRLPERRFEFVPLWGLAFFFLYSMRRVDCPDCGIRVERVPWSHGKSELTTRYAWFLAKWAKQLSWKETAEAFHTTWDKVFTAVQMAVEWGLAHRNLEDVRAIGVDEVLWHRGHKYLTVVYQIDEHRKRLLWIGKDRTTICFMRFFFWFGKERSQKLEFVCSDMWKPYLKVFAYQVKKEWLGAAQLLDRFHIAMNMNKAVNKVRTDEAKELAKKGIDILKNTRWCILKRPERLTERQGEKLAQLEKKSNLRTYRSYLLKESFRPFWDYKSPAWAGKFLDAWCRRAMRSRIDPMKKMAKQLRKHRPLLLNWFKAKESVSLGAVEGLNNRLKLTVRKSYGFRTLTCTKMALYHAMGDLPEPEFTHKFC